MMADRMNIRDTFLSGFKIRGVLIFILCLAFFHPLIVNDVPVLALQKEGRICSPILQRSLSKIGWSNYNSIQEYQWKINPVIPYHSQSLDAQYLGVSPFYSNESSLMRRHWLGTDNLGRDVLAGLLRGLFIALQVGFFSAVLSFVLGVFFGMISGYFGDHLLKVSVVQMIIFGFWLFVSWYLMKYYLWSYLGPGIFMKILELVLIVMLPFAYFAFAKNNYSKGITVPIDMIVQRFMDVFKSIPVLIFLLAILGMIEVPSIWNVIVLIGIVRWPSIARYIRTEMLSVRSSDYMRTAKALGLDDFRMMFKHALPNVLSPVLVSLSFGFAVAILMEASLSFLGIGVPVGEMTLGSMLSEARTDISKWWLALLPGLLIFLLVSLFYQIGQSINSYFNPQAKEGFLD